MLPFITILGKEIPMYGLCMITGAFFSILFACLAAPKKGVVRIDVLLASCFCFIFGLLGAKLLYIITDIPKIVSHIQNNGFEMKWLLERMANSGIVFYGGLIVGFFGGWVYVRMFRLDFWKHADAMIPFLPLAHAFGRMGCFCAGCCYGRQMDPPFGWYFPNAIGAPHDIPLFPVQLFEACFLLVILFPAMLLYSSRRRLPGQVVGLYLTCYGTFRFFNEFLRDDKIRGIFGGVSTSQWISLALVPIGIVLLSGKLSHLLVPKYRPPRSRYITFDDDDSFDDGVAEESMAPPCAVCTGCGACDRMYTEFNASDDNGGTEADPERIRSRTPPPISKKTTTILPSSTSTIDR